MRLTIAGITCELGGLSGPLSQEVEQRYAAFLTDAAPDVLANARVRHGAPGALVDADEPVVDLRQTALDTYTIRRLDNPFEAEVDLASASAELTLADNIYCVDSFLRILYSLLLARTDGLLLHSAAVECGGKAVLLAGVSEAGKTTLCGLGFGTVLSDELVAIRRHGSRFVAHGTPFWGEFVPGRVRRHADVAALYLLRKGTPHQVLPIALPPALLEVLGCVFFFGPPELHTTVLDLAGDLVESRLAGAFRFAPEKDVVAFLDREVREHVA